MFQLMAIYYLQMAISNHLMHSVQKLSIIGWTPFTSVHAISSILQIESNILSDLITNHPLFFACIHLDGLIVMNLPDYSVHSVKH